MLPLFVWIIIFAAALGALVKGADWLLTSAERIGLALGLSPFVIGVVIVGIGTSFPELASSFAAIWKDANEIVVANAVGSNVANILLIVGFGAVIARRMAVDKDLIDLDLPLLAGSTVLFLGVAYDGTITLTESALLLIAFVIQMIYTLLYQDEWTADHPLESEITEPGFLARLKIFIHGNGQKAPDRPKVQMKDVMMLILGLAGVVVGAKYLIDSVIEISTALAIATGAIALIAVAVGTSLPELLVSVKAARKGNAEVALGNIFGSNVFNLLVVVGLPGMFQTLTLDTPTLTIGIPAMLLATFLFVVSGISRKIHIWEGALFLLGYVVFIGKIFDLF